MDFAEFSSILPKYSETWNYQEDMKTWLTFLGLGQHYDMFSTLNYILFYSPFHFKFISNQCRKI